MHRVFVDTFVSLFVASVSVYREPQILDTHSIPAGFGCQLQLFSLSTSFRDHNQWRIQPIAVFYQRILVNTARMKIVLEDPKRLVLNHSSCCSTERADLDITTGELVHQVLLLYLVSRRLCP